MMDAEINRVLTPLPKSFLPTGMDSSSLVRWSFNAKVHTYGTVARILAQVSCRDDGDSSVGQQAELALQEPTKSTYGRVGEYGVNR
jgi:hypothetical protein